MRRVTQSLIPLSSLFLLLISPTLKGLETSRTQYMPHEHNEYVEANFLEENDENEEVEYELKIFPSKWFEETSIHKV